MEENILTAKKPLYLALNLARLKTLIKKSNYGRKVPLLSRISEKLYQKCVVLRATEPVDEELLYIMCTNYLNLVNTIKSQLKDDNFHRSRFSNEISIVDTLKRDCELSLVDRYRDNATPITEPEFELEPVSDLELKPSSSLSLINDEDKFTELDTMYKLIKEGCKFLIMDARPAKQFIDSRVKHKYVINVPQEIIKPGLSTNTLQIQMPPEYGLIFKERHTYDLILLIDLDTTPISYSDSKIEMLRTILTEWDNDAEDKKSIPVVLNGGIKEWVNHYPSMVTNPDIIFNSFFNSMDDILDDVHYPDSIPARNEEKQPVLASSPMVPSAVPPALPPKTSFYRTIDGKAPVIKPKTMTEKEEHTVIMQSILTVADQQLQVEEELLHCIEERCKLMTTMKASQNRREFDAAAEALILVNKDVSQTETYKIVLSERRNLLDAKYKTLKEDTHVRLRYEFVNAMQVIERSSLSKCQKRKKLEKIEDKLKAELKHVAARWKISPHWQISTTARHSQPALPPPPAETRKVIVPPIVPDRKSKPIDFESQVEALRKVFKGSGMVGLVNVRNTCYMNSLVQCLRYCGPWFLHTLINSHIRSNTLAYHFRETIKALWNECNTALRPSAFYAEVCRKDNFERGFANGKHEDVHEFFMFVLRTMHDELVEEVQPRPDCDPKLRDWLKMFENGISVVTKTFYYQLQSGSMCSLCDKSIMRYEYGNTIFINIPKEGDRMIDLNEQLKAFLYVDQHEHDDDAEKYCTVCEAKTLFVKRITFYPTILVLNIARYEFSKSQKCILRRNNPCDLDEEITFGERRYKLKAVSLHTGNKDFGHYMALCFSEIKHRWVEFNDEAAKYTNINDPNYKIMAYLLFYTLISHPYETNKDFFTS